uniref:Uncharacterized protein n=1 Tax=Rhizophora mucronata TaxID=61149 RepID=A0A2P2LHA4_RHIMU
MDPNKHKWKPQNGKEKDWRWRKTVNYVTPSISLSVSLSGLSFY